MPHAIEPHITALIQAIHDHGHPARIDGNGMISATADWMDREGNTGTQTDTIRPTRQDVRAWLGY
jgi:hypothetical protein